MKPAPTLPTIPPGEPHLAVAILADQMALFGLGWLGKRLRDATNNIDRFQRIGECTEALLTAHAVVFSMGHDAGEWADAAMDHCKALQDARAALELFPGAKAS